MTTDPGGVLPGGIVPAGVVPTHPTSSPPPDACDPNGEHVLSDDTARGPGPTTVLCACGRIAVQIAPDGTITHVGPSS